MIDSCQFTKGYPLRLPCIGKKAFRFQTGITLLFGPNGCGKSTLLQAMAAYSAIKGGGWTRYYDPLDLTSLDLAKKRECRLPKNYTVLVRNVFEARVDWDGTPTMYHHASISDQTSFACLFDSAGDSHDGITTPMEQIATIAIKRSQGEMRLQKLHKMFQMMRTPPALQSPAKKDHNEVWKACYDEQERYFKSLPMGGPATLLLDEPDRSLSLTNQMDFWAGIVPHLADRQTIIATHSPLIFFLDYPVNVIDLQQGYYAERKERFRKLKVS